MPQKPTGEPTGEPTGKPSGQPTSEPSGAPSSIPTQSDPTSMPTSSPSSGPSPMPTGQPTPSFYIDVKVPVKQIFNGLSTATLSDERAKLAFQIAIANVTANAAATSIGPGDVNVTGLQDILETRRRLVPGDVIGVVVNYTISIVVLEEEMSDDDSTGGTGDVIASLSSALVNSSTSSGGRPSPLISAMTVAMQDTVDDDTFLGSALSVMAAATVEQPEVETENLEIESIVPDPTSEPTSQPTVKDALAPEFPAMLIGVIIAAVVLSGFGVFYMMKHQRAGKYKKKGTVSVGDVSGYDDDDSEEGSV